MFSGNVRLLYTRGHYVHIVHKDTQCTYILHKETQSNYIVHRAQNLRQGILIKTSFKTRVSRMGLGSFVDINSSISIPWVNIEKYLSFIPYGGKDI